MFRVQLGNRIKHIRENLNLSQEQLASKININRVSLSQIENGQREVSAEELSKFSKIFNIPTDVLLNLKQEMVVVLEKPKKEPSKKKQEIRISVPQENIEKFKEVFLYILDKAGSKTNIGETVIYKLLYFMDFNFYEKFEEQLIGARYIKNHYGPTPVEFAKIVRQMESEKEVVKVEERYFQYPQTKYLPLRKPNIGIFSAHEKDVIDDVLEKLSDMNAAQISDYSHEDVPWLTTEEGKMIEYESVFYRTPAYSVRSYSDEESEESKNV